MATLLDPRTRKEFLALRKENLKLRLDREESISEYKEFEEKSGIPSKTLRAAAGGDEEAFMKVASSSDLSNKEKNEILSGSIGRFQDMTRVKQLPTHTFVKDEIYDVRATVCAPKEIPGHRKYHKVIGGGLRIKEKYKPAKSTNVDFSDINPTVSYLDIFISKLKSPNVGGIDVSPVSSELIIAAIPPIQNKFIAFNDPSTFNADRISNYNYLEYLK